MNRDCSYYRKQRMRVIHRKENILRQLGGEENVLAWEHGAAGRLSKGKIHCSCWMCRSKSYDEPQVRDKRAAINAAQQLLEIEWLLSRKTLPGQDKVIATASGEGPQERICVGYPGSLFTEIQEGHPMHWGCPSCSAPAVQYIQVCIQLTFSQASRTVRNTAPLIHFA